jgi:hypothetical protein
VLLLFAVEIGFLRFQLNNVLITNCVVSVQIGAASTMTNF